MGFTCFSHGETGITGLREEEQRSAIYVTSYQGYILIDMISHVDFDFNHMAVKVLVRFLHWKAPQTLPHSPILFSLEGSHYVQPMLMGWDLCPHPKVENLHKLLEIILQGEFLSSHLFICLFIPSLVYIGIDSLFLHLKKSPVLRQ